MSLNIGLNLSQEVSPSKISSLSPQSWKNASSTSWKEFNRRVASFLIGEASLELKPVVLSPAACARYGWKSVGKCILQCVACNAVLCGKLPYPWNSEAYDECVKTLVESLKSSHKKNCPWFLAPSPEHFVRMHPMDKNEASSDLIDRIESLLTLEALPVLENKIVKRLEITEKQIDALCQSSHLPSDRYSKSAIVLALTGWSRSPSTEKKKYLWCGHCQRIVALWFYTLTNSSHNVKTDEKHTTSDLTASMPLNNNSISNKNTLSTSDTSLINTCNGEKIINGIEENDTLIQKDANLELVKEGNPDIDCEKKEEFLSPTRKRYKMSSQDESDLFDPLYEHRNWCMWICEGGVVNETDDENPKNFGWQIFLKSILRGIESPVTSEFIRHVSKEKVKRVRQMLENWS